MDLIKRLLPRKPRASSESESSEPKELDHTIQSKPSELLALPREIRDQIIGEVLFPGEREPEKLNQDRYGLAITARRQIWPYHPNNTKRLNIDVAVLQVCRQLQYEGEAILYGSSSFNLMYDDWSPHQPKLSYQFFEHLPKRLRRLIQRVERKCYSQPYLQSITPFEWNAFMRFLAEECPSLHTLKLWGPGDRNEGPLWVETCTQDHEWVHTLLQIKTLTYFDIPVIDGGNIYSFPQFRDDFLPWLKKTLTEQSPRSEYRPLEDKPFPLLKLPFELREMIYGHAVLSSDRRIYVDMKPWFNKEMQAARSLILTCKQIHAEVEHLVCREQTFYGDRPGSVQPPFGGLALLTMDRRLAESYRPKHHTSRLASLLKNKSLRIKHLDFFYCQKNNIDITQAATRHGATPLESIRIRLDESTDNSLRYAFRQCLVQQQVDSSSKLRNLSLVLGRTYDTLQKVPKSEWLVGSFKKHDVDMPRQLLRLLARTPNVTFRNTKSPSEIIVADYAIWLSKGLREEFLRGESGIPGLEWLYVSLGDGWRYDKWVDNAAGGYMTAVS